MTRAHFVKKARNAAIETLKYHGWESWIIATPDFQIKDDRIIFPQ